MPPPDRAIHRLECAEGLLTGIVGRPRQAVLRVALSTSYYSLFAWLTHSASAELVARSELPRTAALVERVFKHTVMKKAARAFESGRLPPHLSYVGAVPAELGQLGATFCRLQEQRHLADYSPLHRFNALQTRQLLTRTRQHFDRWQYIESGTPWRVFLISLAFWDDWGR